MENKIFSNTHQIIQGMKNLANQLSHGSVSYDDEMKWMLAKAKDQAVKATLPKMTIHMLHILECIDQSGPINCAHISLTTTIPKGTVSKVAKKLIHLDLVTMETLPNNKKEKLYKASPLGQRLATVHRQLHDHFEAQMEAFVGKYSEAEQAVIARFLDDYLATSKAPIEEQIRT